MKKKSKIFVSLAVLSLLLILGVSTVIAAPAPKMDVCHRTGNGSYILINVNGNALPAHLAHGDGVPGDMVPGMTGKKFATDCSVVDANADVSGTWRGQSGYYPGMGYWFYMYLNQDAAGNVTGTVNYDIGIVRTVTGSVSGNTFTFTTSDSSYWATCTNCNVSTDGTHFEGTGAHSSNTGTIGWTADK